MCLAVLATASLAACSTNQTPSSAGPDNGQTSPPAATAAASEPAAAPSPTPTGVQNLVITSAEKSDLTAAFVAFKGISLSDVLGGAPTPGSVYYAYDPATDTYWALAGFETSPTASMQVQVNFQDGGNMGMYRKVGTGAWQVQLGGVPPWCAESTFFPLPVLAAWSMPTTKPAGLGC
jgi:hypothetical protein